MHSSSDGKQSLKQMVPTLPIGWSDSGSRGPMTLIGMREWQDVKAGLCANLRWVTRVDKHLVPGAGEVQAALWRL